MSLEEINILIQVVQNRLVLYSREFARNYYYYGKICDTIKGYLCKYPTYVVELENYKVTDLEYANTVALYLLENNTIKKEYLQAKTTPPPVLGMYDIYFGATDTSVVTESDVLALITSNVILPSNREYFTGDIGKNHNFAIPEAFTISEIIDTDAGGSDILPFFSIAIVSILGENYKLYKMENAVPYLSSHTFNINII